MTQPIKPETIKALEELIEHDPKFESHLQKLLKLRKDKAYMYQLAILKLNAIK